MVLAQPPTKDWEKSTVHNMEWDAIKEGMGIALHSLLGTTFELGGKSGGPRAGRAASILLMNSHQCKQGDLEGE